MITASLNVTSRSATLTINPAAGGADTVSITRAEYAVGNRRLRVEATSTRANATLQAFVTSSNQLIGTLSNNGGGRYRGEFTGPSIHRTSPSGAISAVKPRDGNCEIIPFALAQSSATRDSYFMARANRGSNL